MAATERSGASLEAAWSGPIEASLHPQRLRSPRRDGIDRTLAARTRADAAIRHRAGRAGAGVGEELEIIDVDVVRLVDVVAAHIGEKIEVAGLARKGSSCIDLLLL